MFILIPELVTAKHSKFWQPVELVSRKKSHGERPLHRRR